MPDPRRQKQPFLHVNLLLYIFLLINSAQTTISPVFRFLNRVHTQQWFALLSYFYLFDWYWSLVSVFGTVTVAVDIAYILWELNYHDFGALSQHFFFLYLISLYV